MASRSKTEMFEVLVARVTDLGFTLIGEDRRRPWGGFLLVDESQASFFAESWFPELDTHYLEGYAKLSPKFLLVEPHAMLSWQYHLRRSEIWRLIAGEASLVRSHTDTMNPPCSLELGEVVELACGERHRLVGASKWGIVAEIWKHEEAQHPSDEDDIIRVEDAYGR
ncbi:MAG: phosphoheptose isomerase [Rhodothermaeota bacterium MED-G64]|nr:MAG: phosphoheptose isomerase [Rhodothermaeota bacterium MED-G64]HBD43085.1 phosphoheptose isomerase [Bacteroidota bacterium]|tara:strand:- start:215 stop:715 length:501 start_codon:yes stop_codon:yes gene_type:complete